MGKAPAAVVEIVRKPVAEAEPHLSFRVSEDTVPLANGAVGRRDAVANGDAVSTGTGMTETVLWTILISLSEGAAGSADEIAAELSESDPDPVPEFELPADRVESAGAAV